MGNEKWMGIHTFLLSVTLGAWIYLNIAYFNLSDILLADKVWNVCNTAVYLLMALIMNQVNYPAKMVWAHIKLDTND
jgi:hypothetical protein